MISSTIKFNEKKYPVSFYRDDTIDNVQKQISKSIDIHPDRLFILVGIKLPKSFYKQDPRNWERLFNRLSLDGTTIKEETFKMFCSTRNPSIIIDFKEMSKEEWMQTDELQKIKYPEKDFIEYRILGVEALKSYCLPIEISQIAFKIPSAQYPIPEQQKLFLSFYENVEISDFIVKEAETEDVSPYFPIINKTTPQKLSEEQIVTLEENFKHLTDLLSIKPPEPIDTKILKCIWKIQLVDTSFGEAIRTRFEQMFYGLTLSKDSPAVTFWTSSNEISRHKFFRNSGEEMPLIDLAMWKRWFTISKPARDKVPILIMYRGTSREIFDRITISPYDIIFASYRTSENTEDLKTLKDKLLSWFKSLDSIISLIKETDYELCRLDIQEIKFESFYKDEITKFDISRLNCLAGIFDQSKKNKSLFRFLRSDHTNDDINPRELKVINLLKENRLLTPVDIEQELKIGLQESSKLLDLMNKKIEEEPDLLTREHRKFPKVEIRQKSILVTETSEIDRYLKYSNLLRYMLSNPVSKEIDKICPKKLEISNSTFSISSSFDIDVSDIFDYLEKEPTKKEKEKESDEAVINSGYSYFHNKLKKNYDLVEDYPKQCEKPHQPIIFTEEDIAAISGTPYNPRDYPEDEKLEIEETNGLFLCPEYWCMTDEIPLKKSQLEEIDGNLVCPVCHGKLRSNDKTLDITEFSVIERKTGFSFPKFKNNKKNIPCCYKTQRKQTIEKNDDLEKYYIMNEDKVSIPSFRLAYISKSILNSLRIEESYELVKVSNRIQSSMSGFFRVGIIKPSIELPVLLNINKHVLSPRFSILCLLRCAFVTTWSKTSDKYSEEIEEKLTMKPFSKSEVAKKNMAKIISSISEDFENGTLNQIYELEYTAIILKIDLFRINILDQTISCSFYTPQVKVGSKGIVLLQLEGRIDCLSYVSRTAKNLIFKSNIFEEPFKDSTVQELKRLRRKACDVSLPTFNKIYVEFILKRNIENFTIILDPFGRSQAIYSPNKFILPFQSISTPPSSAINPSPTYLSGFKNIKDLPSYETMMKLVDELGYGFDSNIIDKNNNIVEILTKSGLRIPVSPKVTESGKTSEVFNTIIENDESELTFGEKSKEDLNLYKKISYKAEIHEFLIFQLSKDLDKYPALKNALYEKNNKKIEILLYSWFDEITVFMKLDKPIEFLSKIRKPCGQLKKETCNTGHMCAWTDNKCKIQIRDEFSKDKVFEKLLGTLIENSKIRALVLDGKVTPFFSTILYLELPNEIFMTDIEIKQFTYTEP
jgi:hypothetical protein